MIDYLLANLAQTLIVSGLVVLGIEILILGFATFVLFYVGCGAIATGILLMLGVVPNDPLMASVSVAVLSGLIAVFTWRPLKAMQNNVEHSVPTNDMIGNRFVLEQELALGQHITVKYSGIDWQVSADNAIAQGCEVEIVEVSVGKLTVKAAA